MNESDKLDEMLILGTDSDIIGNLYNIEIDVEDSIVNYKGNNDFILSLRNWISSGKELTYRNSLFKKLTGTLSHILPAASS